MYKNLELSVEMVERENHKEFGFQYDFIKERNFKITQEQMKKILETYEFEELNTGVSSCKEFKLDRKVKEELNLEDKDYYFSWYITYDLKGQ